MKKTILTILICGFMVLGITGCGGKKKYELSIPKEENVESILFEKMIIKKKLQIPKKSKILFMYWVVVVKEELQMKKAYKTIQ